jgi:hypothetical protein
MLILFFSVTIIKNKRTKDMMVGEYINQNYNYTPFLGEIPYVSDRLEIFSDGTFKSSFFGEGEYELSSSLSGNISIDFKYRNSIFSTNIERDFFGNPKIILFKVKNHHYKKIE